jgi:hypothetical protein
MMQAIGALIFVTMLGCVLWLMFRDPPEDRWDGTDMGDGGFGGS